MEKAGFRAFIYSFSLSLSAIFAADKVFLHASQESHDDLIISNKNIVLFLNDTQQKPVRALPVKKIALSVLPEIPKPLPDTHPLRNPEAEPKIPEDSIIMADAANDNDFNFNYIPLDIEIGTEDPASEISDTTEQPRPTAEIINSEPLPAAAEVSAGIEKPTSPALQPKENINKIVVVRKEPAPPEIKIAGREERSISESRPQKPLNKVPESEKKQPQTILAAAEDNEPMLLIPLERGNGLEFAGQGMQVSADSEGNQVAAADKNVPIKSLGAPEKPAGNDSIVPTDDGNAWKSMAELKAEKEQARQTEKKTAETESEAWAVAKGRDHPKNRLILEADTNKSEEEIQQVLRGGKQAAASRSGEIQVAGEMIDNLLIPIPQDILDDENLTPQLTSSEENRSIERELDEERGIVREQPEEKTENGIKILDAQGRNVRKKEGGLLSSITSIFSGGNNEKSPEETAGDDGEGIIDSIARKMGGKKESPKILPTEIRLSFQPNRAEISGTTLQWIQAFGKKAAEEASIALEIRLNGRSDHILQQKRLNLLSNILAGRGVDSNKIRVVYTVREPNSFVMRTIRINEQSNETTMKNNTPNNNGYYLQW